MTTSYRFDFTQMDGHEGTIEESSRCWSPLCPCREYDPVTTEITYEVDCASCGRFLFRPDEECPFCVGITVEPFGWSHVFAVAAAICVMVAVVAGLAFAGLVR